MDRQGWAGIIVGLLGITGSAAVGALAILHPTWAGAILWISGAVSTALFVAGVALIFWPRRRRMKAPNDSFVYDEARERAEWTRGAYQPTPMFLSEDSENGRHENLTFVGGPGDLLMKLVRPKNLRTRNIKFKRRRD